MEQRDPGARRRDAAFDQRERAGVPSDQGREPGQRASLRYARPQRHRPSDLGLGRRQGERRWRRLHDGECELLERRRQVRVGDGQGERVGAKGGGHAL